MLFIEFVAIPGFGIFGITGIVVLFYGLYLLLIPDIPVGPEVYSEALDGFSWAIVVGIFGIIFLLRIIGKSAFFQKLISTDSNRTTLKKNYKNRSKVE
jgi:membrane-bound serine protease (ClpP class)